MNSVVDFEMPYDNPERVANCYHTAFGWKTQPLGERMGNRVLATTTETDPDVAMLERPRNSRDDGTMERGQQKSPVSPREPGVRSTPDKGDQEWSPRHSSDQPVEGERDDSYGADGMSRDVKTPRATKKSSPSKGAGNSGGRSRR